MTSSSGFTYSIWSREAALVIVCFRPQSGLSNLVLPWRQLPPISNLLLSSTKRNTMPEDHKPLLSPTTSGGAGRHTTTATTGGGGKYSLAPHRISFPSSSTSALLYADEDPDDYDLRTSGYRPTPTRNRSAAELAAASGSRRGRDGDLESGRERRQGVPKLTRECLWS
jgi:hypothetical protein